MTLEELQIKFTAEMGGLSSQLNSVKQQVGGIAAPTTKAQGALSNLAKMGAMLGGAAIGVKLLQVGKEALQMANDAVESESLFEVSMGGMAESTRKWSEDLSKALGLNAYEVRKSAGTFNVMFDAMGIGATKSQEMSQELTALAQDMASFYNLSPEEAFTKLSAGMTGEMEGLKRLGILVDEATVSQYAYENGIAKTGEKLTQQQKVLARYGTIMKQTSKAQGDLARTAESPANQLRRMTAQVDAAKIALGTALQPALLAIIPVLTSMAVGAGNLVTALSGVGKGNKDAFSEIALTIDEARELVKASVDMSTIELVDKIEVLDQKVNAALTDYMTAEKAVKKVQIEIALDPPTTTGEERITTALDDLKALVPTTLDTKPIYTKLDVITEDGEITAKDEKAMERTLNLWSAKEIKKIKIDAKNKTKAIDAQIKAGEITEAEGSNLKQAVADAATKAIGAITATVTTINAEVAAGAASLATVSFTPAQAIELGTALSKAVNAQEIAVSAEVDKVEATWAGDGAIGDTVTGIYTDVQAAFVAKNAELKAIAEKMLTGVSTAQMWDDAIRIKEEIRQMTAFMFESNEKYGAIFSEGFSEGGMTGSISNMLTAIDEYVTEETEKSKKLLNEKIGDIMSLPPDIFESKFKGKTPAEIIAALRADAEKETSIKKNTALIEGIKLFGTQITKSFEEGFSEGVHLLDAMDALDLLQGLDFTLLDDKSRQAALDMISAFDLSTLPKEVQDAFAEILKALQGEKPKVGAAGKGITDSLRQALEDGQITQAQYKKIIGTENSKTALEALKAQFLKDGDKAAASLVQGLLSQLSAVSAAGVALSNAAKNGASGNSMYSVGSNFAGTFVDGMRSQLSDVIYVGEQLSDAAKKAMKQGLRIKSPSKEGMEIGSYLGEGFAIGIDKSANLASNAAANLANSAMGALQGIRVSSPSVSSPSLGSSPDIGKAVEMAFSKLNIELVVDGERLGRASIKAINEVQQRTGRKLVVT